MLRQHFAAIRCHQEGVFQTYPPDTGQIDARLNGDDHPRLKQHIVVRHNPRLFVISHPQPMPRMVRIRLIARAPNRLPQRPIQIAGAQAGRIRSIPAGGCHSTTS